MFGLVGTDRVCERCVVFGRFLAGSFALKVCWLTGVGFSQSRQSHTWVTLVQ